MTGQARVSDRAGGTDRQAFYVNVLVKRDEGTGEWRELHDEELNDLHCSPTTFRMIKSRRMRWEGHVARMGERRGVYRVLMGKPEGKNLLEDPSVDRRIILRWIFRK
jgi:hypothetical protein